MGEKLSQTVDSEAKQAKTMKKMTSKLLNGNGSQTFTRPVTKHENIYPQLPEQKSLLIAYICWLFGGFFGLHHLYLHRDKHAFVWWCTLGGYFGIGWLYEVFKIPEYVRDANEHPEFIHKFVEKMRLNKRPPFSTTRFIGSIVISYLFGQVAQIAVPEDEFMGINFRFLLWTIPFFAALGKISF